MDDELSASDPRRFVELVRDQSRPAIDESLIRENTLERIRDLMGLLNPMERDIIIRRFGLGTDTDQTLDESVNATISRERSPNSSARFGENETYVRPKTHQLRQLAFWQPAQRRCFDRLEQVASL